MSRLSFRNLQKGFTIIEMITVVAIITIMTGVVLANFPDFRERASLELVAQEISLVIRQAQAFGSQTRSIGSGTFPSFGVYFDLNPNDSDYYNSPNKLILYGDKNGDQHWTATNIDGCGTSDVECREVYTLSGGLEFVAVQGCTDDACTAPVVLSQATTPAGSAVNILFRRPDPEAQFTKQSGAVWECSPSVACPIVRIVLKSTRNGAIKNVYVWNTGHIYVK